jgi:excisionase family DNA binding protein
MDQLMYHPAEAARILGVGRTALFGLLKSGRLRSVKLGSCRFVTADALRAFVRELEEEAAGAADAKAA